MVDANDRLYAADVGLAEARARLAAAPAWRSSGRWGEGRRWRAVRARRRAAYRSDGGRRRARSTVTPTDASRRSSGRSCPGSSGSSPAARLVLIPALLVLLGWTWLARPQPLAAWCVLAVAIPVFAAVFVARVPPLAAAAASPATPSTATWPSAWLAPRSPSAW
ncbi:MAG: hypothetical protein MZW92_15620 [Comamonadaceae bacterium]|nr:hypothetical protein [Comamonadaceae bacterium]